MPALLAGSLLAGNVAKAAEILRAGSPPSSKPNSFLDVKTNTIQGFMPDVINEIGRRAGFKVDFQPVPFPALIPSLTSDKIDLIVAGMTPTAKRAEVVDFSDVVVSFGEGLIVKESDPKVYHSAKDLAGETAGAGAGTNYFEAIQKLGVLKELKAYDTGGDMIRDVQLGRIKGAFNDYPILKAQYAAGAMPGLRLEEHYVPVHMNSSALAVRKGNKALLDKINDGIRQMKADGTLTKLQKKWGYIAN
jgi:polar amino acid transport system substrate-binding protein